MIYYELSVNYPNWQHLNQLRYCFIIGKENSSSSPTYSIDFDPGAGITHLDIDLVPCFKIEGWPEVARRINPQWIQADSIVNDSMKSFDVVCKACPQGIQPFNGPCAFHRSSK